MFSLLSSHWIVHHLGEMLASSLCRPTTSRPGDSWYKDHWSRDSSNESRMDRLHKRLTLVAAGGSDSTMPWCGSPWGRCACSPTHPELANPDDSNYDWLFCRTMWDACSEWVHPPLGVLDTCRISLTLNSLAGPSVMAQWPYLASTRSPNEH